MESNAATELTRILGHADTAAELAVLLEGLLTPQEVEEAVVRWRLMLRLLSGQTQRDIGHDLGISLGTIARGSRLLKYGPPEFRRLIERLAAETAGVDESGAPGGTGV